MYQSLLGNIILPIGDFLNKSSYIKELNYWRKVDYYSEDDLNKLQIKNLSKLLKHTIKTVPYYSKFDVNVDNPEELLRQFPIIDKFTIRDNSDTLISKDFNKENLISYSSSGSSGVQTTVYMTKKEQSVIRGILTHWWEWSGYKVGKPIVQTGITPNRGFLKSIKDQFFHTIYLNAFSHTQDQLKSICEKLKRKPDQFFMAGYASSLHVLATYALENGYNHLQVKGIISLGDKLFSHYKKNITDAFHARIYDTYGSNEGLMIAAQDDLEAYYILSPHVYLEILDDAGNEVEDGTMGNLVVTRLDCFSMPLIRYKLGDLGIKLPKEKYPEKRKYNYPLLQQVVGRETDIILLPNEDKMVVHSFTGIFEYIPEIKQFKVIQEDISGIVIEYIKSNNFKESAIDIATKELRKYIKDEEFFINFKEVSYIAPTKSGKPQIIESRLKK
jgi:phenylacetate-CoA ligase